MRYYVNQNEQDNGDHEVHRADCSWMPEAENREYLGDFSSCSPSVAEAKRRGYRTADGCFYCSNACHTS